jgi:hypothetical protein
VTRSENVRRQLEHRRWLIDTGRRATWHTSQ